MELLVGMALTAIISVIAFYSYLLIQKQFFQLQKNQNIVSEYQEIRSLLKEDFSKAIWIKKTPGQLLLNREDGFVYYDILQHGLVRYHSTTPSVKDTLQLDMQYLNVFHNGATVEEGLIDSLVINVNIFEEVQRLCIKKTYSAEVLINHEAHEY